MRRQQAGLAQGLAIAQAQQPLLGLPGVLRDRLVLPVGRDLALLLTPQVIHRVQLRALLGQPHQGHIQLRRQPPAGGALLATGLVQQQPQRPAPIPPTQLPQVRLEVRLPHLPPPQRHPPARPQIDRPEQHPPVVLPGDGHDRLLSPPRPAGPQRREHPQDRGILRQQRRLGRHPL